MTDFAFPLPRPADSLPYFSRPGTVLPTLPTPVAGSFENGVPNQPERSGAILPTRSKFSVQPGEPFILQSTYDAFWKDRLHVIETSFAAGNVLTPKQNTVEIYNAGTKLPAKTVSSITIVGDANIAIISGNVSTPFDLGLGESEVYVYEIDASGNPTIIAQIEWDFVTNEQLVHKITGTRSLLFNFEPQLPVRETFSWLTSVLESVDGTEKRQALRELPRQQIGYNYMFGDNADATNMLIENYFRDPRMLNPTGLPVWLDRTELTAAVSPGDTVLSVLSTSNRDFRALGEQGLAIIRTSRADFEVVGVASFGATSITTSAPILNGWPIGTEVYPVRSVNIASNPGQDLKAYNAREMTTVWDIRTGVDYGDETSFAVYKTFPVFDDLLTLDRDQYTRRWDWDIVRLGGATSLGSTTSLRSFPSIVSVFKLFWDNKAEYSRLRNWLHARRGKQKSFWMATNRIDFILETEETVLGAIMRTEITDYTELFATSNYIDIRVKYRDGTFDYREVISVILSAGVRETLTVDSNFSQIIDNANVESISLLVRHRMAQDSIEFFHENSTEGSVAFEVMELVE